MKKLFAASFAAVLALALAACGGSATFSQFMGDAKVEIENLDGTVEGDFELPYTNVGLDIELTSGSIDIEVVDVMVTYNGEDEEVVPLDTIGDAQGLVSGDHASFTDDDGAFLLRITSNDKATGTITITEEG